MKKILVFLFCPTLLATMVLAYDWSDTDFNLILQEDYLESLDYLDNIENGFTSVHSRIARQAVTTTTLPTTTTTEKNTNCRPTPARPTPQNASNGNNRYQRTCCGDRDDLKMHGDALKEIRRECFAEIRRSRSLKAASNGEPFDMFNCRKVGKSKDDLICVMECVAKKKNLIDNQGYISRQNTTNFVKDELVKTDWQKKIIDNILEKCLKDSENRTLIANSTFTTTAVQTGRNISDSASDEKPCNPSTLQFSHCIWREMQLSCPSDQIRETRQCQRMRERLQNKEYPDFSSKNEKKNKNDNNDNKSNNNRS